MVIVLVVTRGIIRVGWSIWWNHWNLYLMRLWNWRKTVLLNSRHAKALLNLESRGILVIEVFGFCRNYFILFYMLKRFMLLSYIQLQILFHCQVKTCFGDCIKLNRNVVYELFVLILHSGTIGKWSSPLNIILTFGIYRTSVARQR